MPDVKTMVAWCLPCREHKTIENPQPRYVDGVKGKRLQHTGRCPDCGNIVNRFLRSEDLEADQEVVEDVVSESEPQTDQTTSGDVEEDAEPARVWVGACQRCREESEFTGRYIGRRFDGKNVIDGVCVLCEAPQIVIGAEERVTGDG